MSDEHLKHKVFAQVRVTVKVALSQPWSDKEAIASVHERAGRDGLDALRRALNEANVPGAVLSISSGPEVTLVTSGGPVEGEQQ